MITVKIKNSRRNKEIIAEDIDDAMYKLAQEKTQNSSLTKHKISNDISLYNVVKDKVMQVEAYKKISKDEMNER